MKILEKRTVLTLEAAALVVLLWAVSWVYDLMESDPLTVTAPGEMENFTVHAGDVFTFERNVCTTKDLVVTVHREFHNIDNGKKYMLKSIRYVAYAEDGCYATRFDTEVPKLLHTGAYEYRPILIYNTNASKTVAKPAPFVHLEVIDE